MGIVRVLRPAVDVVVRAELAHLACRGGRGLRGLGGFAGRVAIQSARNRAWKMALRATQLSARVRGPKRAARRSRLHHPRFACSVRARRNRGSISITHGGTCNHAGNRSVTAEGRIVGLDGKVYATGTTSCLVLKMEQ